MAKELERIWKPCSTTIRTSREHEVAEGATVPKQLRVLTLNVLADGVGLDEFILAPQHCLTWEYRSTLLLQALTCSGADIICLQEINHFHDGVQTMMQAQGFDGVFAEKTNSPAEKFGMPKDGCATFIRSRCFTLLNHERVPFSGGASQIMHLLYIAESSRPDQLALVVLNTHLKAKKENESVRVQQVSQVLSKLEEIEKQFPDVAVIVCGDFNSEPNSESCGMMKNKLKSAYEELETQPEFFSTWKVRLNGEVRRTIDYIFYTPSKMSTIRVLDAPKVVPDEKFPNAVWPSDHISLVADFILRQ